MREITYRDALREALREEMLRDETVFLLGEDIGRYWHGAFKVTKGLAEEFGDERVRDTPISESAIIGVATGAAITGMRPVAEIMFGDLSALAMDQIANQAAKLSYMFGGQVKVPLVIRMPFGAGVNIASHHSQSLEAWFMHVPGLKIAMPSTPYDAKGLLKTAIQDDNPVMFFEHKLLYAIGGVVPEEEYTIP
ncbi:MAG: alpha-ketoacid dehydrogenase subunit beta, partial [Candidatus Bathyarchaeota archaeon]|nr:alpha-ketoacid dehydrogenase subunit beta [Candidatus Bathyarchaeota archaeon]